MLVGCFCFHEAVITFPISLFNKTNSKWGEALTPIVGETAYYVRQVQNSFCSKCKGDTGRGVAMLFAPLCVTQVLAEAQESRDRLMTGGEVRDLTSKSSSEYRTLFLWKRRGQGERRKHQWPTLDQLLNCLNLFEEIFQWQLSGTGRGLMCTGRPARYRHPYKCHGKKEIIQSIST